MAYTEPRTYTDGELVTAAILNVDHRDNMRSMGPHLIVRKTADESVVSSLTPQDDDALFFAIGANEIWRFDLMVIVTGLFDFRAQFTFPSGRVDGSAWGTNNGTTTIEIYNLSSSSSPSQPMLLRADSTTVPRVHFAQGIVANGGAAGDVRLQWAQVSSGGTATIVKANSTLWGVKIA